MLVFNTSNSERYVSSIQPGNLALKYIDDRLGYDSYRGGVSSEHNRYDMNEIFCTLRLLNDYMPSGKVMRIRDTDLSKRPFNTLEEEAYAKFCDAVYKTVGKGSQDSIRKNIFVDMHRMGFINRYDADFGALDPYERGSVKYVGISQLGYEFVNSSDILDRAFIFTGAINRLLNNYVDILMSILSNVEQARVSEPEFMFFVTAVDAGTEFSIGVNKCLELIREYRSLSTVQRKSVIETLKSALVPSRFSGDKKNKRDWHNWKNKSDQVFYLLKQSPYFEVVESNSEIAFISLSTQKRKTRAGEIIEVGKRSLAAKHDYFNKHGIKDKQYGYELHHVVPLSWAKSLEQYKLFDNWKNMVYIDAYTHELITRNRNRNVYMSPCGDTDLILSDRSGCDQKLLYQHTILYKLDMRSIMLSYNNELTRII